jgi:glycosyltransferase involved in cell wall biosynthesis
MIRVLHVIDHLGLGGAQSAVLDLVSNMDTTEVECQVAVLHGRGPFAEALESRGITVHSLSSKRWPPAYVKSLPALVEKNRFDVLHFHLQGANWLSKPLLGRKHGAVVIAHDHTSGDVRFRGLHSLLPDALSHLASDHIIAVSDGVRRFLTSWEAVPGGKISVIPNGVDTRLFRPAGPDQRRTAKKALGFSEDSILIGAMGRMAPEKNFRILPRLAEHLPGIVFVVGGDGPGFNELKSLIAGSAARARIRLLGRVDNRAGFYAAMDAYVLPSLFEGLPMALLEAMASGLPCVASRLPDITAALDNGKSGLLANPEAPETFVEALRLMTSDSDSASRLGRAARARCEASFSAGLAAAAVLNVYRKELLFARNPTGC